MRISVAACLWGLSGCDLGAQLYDTEGERACEERNLFYADEDGDGVGNEASVYLGCEQPEGWVTVAGDCDDSDASRTANCSDTGGADTGETGDTDTGDSDSGGA